MKQVKITVLKTTLDKELAEKYAVEGMAPCSIMKEGQVFYAGRAKPEGFCDTAWRCIYQYVFALANGGGENGFFFGDWIKTPKTAISSCNDGLRLVIFLLEATDNEVEKDV